MNGKFKIKFEWPGLTADILLETLNISDGIEQINNCLYWTLYLGLGDNILEATVRRFEDQSNDDTSVIRICELSDLRHLASIINNGGIHNLLCIEDVNYIFANINARLYPFWQRLETENKVYIFSAHRNAIKCMNYCNQLGIKLISFIDNDPKKYQANFHGYPVCSLSDIPRNALIVNASGRYCIPINEQLNEQGYSWNIDFMEFLFLFDLPFQAEKNFRAYVEQVFKHRFDLISLYVRLADDYSRNVLDRLALFRIQLESSATRDISSPYDQEFFAPDVLSFGPNEVFVDGGAYDGDSFSRFKSMAPDFRKAYLFEPDAKICRVAEVACGIDARVFIGNYGLWSSSGELRFSSTGGMDGSISETGNLRVPVVSIDEFITHEISHIKLDVEGAEEHTLRGARRAISEYRPKMAIALYHRASDLWSLPCLIEELAGKYKFSIRHYSQTIDDTIIYALPN